MALARQYIEKDFYTEEEYLTWEQDAVEKSEYVDGQILAMSGGSEPHASIPMNVGALLWNGLRGRGCRVLSSDMKVWTAGAFYYPDLSVVCGPSQYRGRNRNTITNPIAVVEVLSPSTEAKDRGEKFIRYQQIETLRSYLLVSQTEPLVELFSRGENGHWDYEAIAGLESIISIPSLEITLALTEIYDQVSFSDAMDDRREATMVTLENIEQHIIPFDQFELKWRFTEEKYNFLPPHHLEQIRPLDKSASNMLNEMTNALFDNGPRLSQTRFPHIEWVGYINSLEGEQKIKKWLYRLGLPFDREVYASWDSQNGAVTTWKMIVKYWSDFEYADDLVIVDKSLNWAVVFYHYDQIEFGTNNERYVQICENELVGTDTF